MMLQGLVLAPTRELALQIASQVGAMSLRGCYALSGTDLQPVQIATLQGPRYAFLLVGGTEEVRDQLQQLQQTDAQVRSPLPPYARSKYPSLVLTQRVCRYQILVASPDRLLRVLEEVRSLYTRDKHVLRDVRYCCRECGYACATGCPVLG